MFQCSQDRLQVDPGSADDNANSRSNAEESMLDPLKQWREMQVLSNSHARDMDADSCSMTLCHCCDAVHEALACLSPSSKISSAISIKVLSSQIYAG